MTPEAARDEIFRVFKSTWDATGYAAVWPDTPDQTPPESEEVPWARVTLQHQDGGQNSLANHAGSKMWEHVGTLFIQIFVPAGQGATPGYPLVRKVMNAYRVARGAVRYTSHRFRETGRDGAFNGFLVLVDFAYDDFSS